MLELKDLHKSYRRGRQALHVLRGVNLTVEPGELVSIMGSSGSGKSTLLNVLGFLDSYDSGTYRLNGQVMQHVSESEAAALRSRHIGFVFQSFNLLNFKSAVENVALPLFYQRVSRKKRLSMAMKYLEMMGLSEWAHNLPSEMSGGQQQRVAIARALISKPSIILADEPTGALDSTTSQEMMDIFQQLHEEGRTVLIVTHEADIAQRTSRTIYIRDGLIIQGENRQRRVVDR